MKLFYFAEQKASSDVWGIRQCYSHSVYRYYELTLIVDETAAAAGDGELAMLFTM